MSKLRIEHLWPLAVLAGVFIFASTHPIRPHDFWWHLKVGQEILATSRIPSVDTFSHTMAGTSYPNYASYWLMEVAYYLIYTAGGPAFIIFAHTLLVTSAYGMLIYLCWRVARSWRVATAATLFAVALGLSNWNVRPQALAFPAGAAILWAIYAYRARPRRWLLAVPPVAVLIWANGHGSFVIGLLLLAIWLADETLAVLWIRLRGGARWQVARLWAPLVTFLASGLACLANPRGPGIAAYVTNLSGSPVIRSLVPEWAAPTFGQWEGAIFLVSLLLIAAMLAVSPRRPGLFQILTYLAFGALALSSSRGIIWFGIAMAPVVAEHLAALAHEWKPILDRQSVRQGRAAANYLFVALLAGGVFLSLPWFKHLLPLPPLKAGLISRETPIAATEVLLRQRPLGPIFNELGFGSYLIWAAQPDYPVFVDTRLELYPMVIWRDYLDISAGRAGWQETLDRYGVNTLMLSPDNQPGLIAAARSSADWRLLYEDDVAVIFVRVFDAPSARMTNQYHRHHAGAYHHAVRSTQTNPAPIRMIPAAMSHGRAGTPFAASSRPAAGNRTTNRTT